MKTNNKTTIDILFVNQPSPDNDVIIRDINRSGRKSRERMIWPQTNLAWEAAVMREAGFKVDLIDCVAYELDWKHVEKIILDSKPKYVVANVISTALMNDIRLFNISKKVNSINIAHGPHVTNKSKEVLEDYLFIDFCILNEAEEVLRELILEIESKRNDFQNILGISWRDGKTVNVNGKRPFIKDLNTLPPPAYDL